MTMEPTQPTDEQDEGVAALEQLAAEAEAGEQAEQARQAADEPDPGEWQDGEQQELQARGMARMAVNGVEMAAGLIRPGHSLDRAAKASGEEALLPVARDFTGEVPEWLRPYMHYLAAGLWIGGVLVGAYRGKRQDEAAAEAARKAEQGAGEGVADGV